MKIECLCWLECLWIGDCDCE